MKIVILAIIVLSLTAVSADAQCPSFRVTGPPGVTSPGDEMKFRVEIGVVGPQLEYFWTVSMGTITEGQGTSKITVATHESMAGGSVTAMVRINGLPSNCEKNGEETAPIDQPPAWCWDLDSYGPLKPNEQRSRIDTFFAELSNNPTNIGLFVLRVTHREKLDSRNSRIQFILRHAKFRNFDRGRLWFALEVAEEPQTVQVRIPVGGEMPPCEGCLIIKGGDL